MAMRYRGIVERILAEEAGCALRLVCTGEEAPPVLPKKKEEKKFTPPAPKNAPRGRADAPKPFNLASVAPEERAPLKRAMDILGGTVEVVEVAEESVAQEEDPRGQDAHFDVPPPDDPPPEMDGDERSDG